LAQANAHFVQQDYNAAIAVLQEIIRIEPNTKSAYHTLSAIHTELGSHEKALQLDIVAAHIVPREGGVWRDLGARSRQAGLLQQAIYCFTSALGVNRNDVDALWDRAVLYGETGQIMKATSAFNTLLRLNPHDPTILRELVPILVKSEQVPDATRKLKDAFDFHVPNSPTGPNEYTLNLEDLIDLANLLNSQRRFKDVIPTVKLGQRWVQGRYETGAVWDLFQDDREYDAERKTRPDWEKNEQLRWLEDMPTYELNLQLRAALGIARLMLNNVEEADVGFPHVRPALLTRPL
jgi:general transcription factor 3C polypeptide 3 (transcription factor C subunit 4)